MTGKPRISVGRSPDITRQRILGVICAAPSGITLQTIQWLTCRPDDGMRADLSPKETASRLRGYQHHGLVTSTDDVYYPTGKAYAIRDKWGTTHIGRGQLVTTKEAAIITGITTGRINKHAREGRLPHTRDTRGRNLYRLADVQKLKDTPPPPDDTQLTRLVASLRDLMGTDGTCTKEEMDEWATGIPPVLARRARHVLGVQHTVTGWGEDRNTGWRINPDHTTPTPARTLADGRPKWMVAADIIQAELADGPRPAGEVIDLLAAHGITGRNTQQHARAHLGVETYGRGRTTMWELPVVEDAA